jgi:hypothetical protein
LLGRRIVQCEARGISFARRSARVDTRTARNIFTTQVLFLGLTIYAIANLNHSSQTNRGEKSRLELRKWIEENNPVHDPLILISIVDTSREPTPLPDEDIERLRFGLPLMYAEPHLVLMIGETVRICRGPLEGMTGIVTR